MDGGFVHGVQGPEDHEIQHICDALSLHIKQKKQNVTTLLLKLRENLGLGKSKGQATC